MKVINHKEILTLLKERHRTFSRISRITGISRSALLRLYYGDTKEAHPKTLGKLMKALNE